MSRVKKKLTNSKRVKKGRIKVNGFMPIVSFYARVARKTRVASKSISSKKITSRKINFSTPESYKSLFYGILTVIILFIIGFGVVKLFANRPKPEIDSRAVSIENVIPSVDKNTSQNGTSNKTYVVKAGESLWAVAVAEYKDGYKWVDIAKANNLANPGLIFKGDKLIIPAESTGTVAQGSTQAESRMLTPGAVNTGEISGVTYVVKRGDDLWDIAVRAYGDGYKWVEISRANNLADPNLIHADNVLKLPR